jgi:hypothetical protein
VTFIAEGSTRVIRHAVQVAHVVVIVVVARGMSLTVFMICWRTMELDLGGLCQPFGMPELLLGCQLSLEEVNPHLVLASVLVQALDLLSEEQIFSCAGDWRCRPGGCLASRKSPCPQLEVWDSCECLNGEGL